MLALGSISFEMDGKHVTGNMISPGIYGEEIYKFIHTWIDSAVRWVSVKFHIVVWAKFSFYSLQSDAFYVLTSTGWLSRHDSNKNEDRWKKWSETSSKVARKNCSREDP